MKVLSIFILYLEKIFYIWLKNFIHKNNICAKITLEYKLLDFFK